MIAVCENPLPSEATDGALRARTCPLDEHLGSGAAGQPHEL
jgi:hypothetical protein